MRDTGAAIYATDIRLCQYEDPDVAEGDGDRSTIFDLPFIKFK